MSSHRPREGGLGRRDFVRLSAGGVVLGALPGAMLSCSKSPSPATVSEPPRAPTVVRVLSVPTAVEGNVLPTLIADFEKQSAYRVELSSNDDVYGPARLGLVDLSISHYGHKHAESFVMEGYGEWPRTLFSNQMALLGPPGDPARVRGLSDAGEAFRRIAASKSPYVLNDIDGVHYLTEILWNAAGRPDRASWFIDERQKKEEAIRAAAEKKAYAFWGLTPFLRLQKETPLALEPLVLGDPLLQRMLVSIVTKPSKVPGVNAAGAMALESHLLSPAAQARIRGVGYPGAEHVLWVPGGRHNRTGILPKT